MAVIFCGKAIKKPYYIKESDVNIYSIQELAYYIYNYAMLITKNFVSKNLIFYIAKELDMIKLAENLNIAFNRKEDISEMLKIILRASNYYDEREVVLFDKKLWELLGLDEISYINLSGDSLYKLGKYEKAIIQYKKNADRDLYALKMLGYSYAKLQLYDKAIEYLKFLFERKKDIKTLKDLYFCYKLSGNTEEFYEYKQYVSDDITAEWEIEIVTLLLNARNKDNVKSIEDIFMMGDKYIIDNMKININLWKEKYRYIG